MVKFRVKNRQPILAKSSSAQEAENRPFADKSAELATLQVWIK